MTYYVILDSEADLEYNYYKTYKEAYKNLRKIEKQDKKDDIFIENYYRIIKKEKNKMEELIEDTVEQKYNINIEVYRAFNLCTINKIVFCIKYNKKEIAYYYNQLLTLDENCKIIYKSLINESEESL